MRVKIFPIISETELAEFWIYEPYRDSQMQIALEQPLDNFRSDLVYLDWVKETVKTIDLKGQKYNFTVCIHDMTENEPLI